MGLSVNDHRISYRFDDEHLIIEPWGENSLRVRSWRGKDMPKEAWALMEAKDFCVNIEQTDAEAVITNGKISATILENGRLTFKNEKGQVLLDEYVSKNYLRVPTREFVGTPRGDYEINIRFQSDPKEKLFGMGQYQQNHYNLKGCDLELAHRNSQSSVPFVMSSLGYGFLWNNPAIGRVVFGMNTTTWHAFSTKSMDYWITAGDTPAEIEESYVTATGKVPMMPDYGMGFWQCKMRYQTQEELLEAAREYHRLEIPVKVIVADFYHWTLQGEWKFNPKYWPDPEAMIEELKKYGMELMISIWPTVDWKSENYDEMIEKGYLTQVDKGPRMSFCFTSNAVYYDATNPEAQKYLWEKVKKNYYSKGVKIFWLDQAEPATIGYDFDIYRYHVGPVLQTGNIYPMMYSKNFYDGMQEEGQENIVNLVRTAWAGSQRYGALVWSGDIASSFESFRYQVISGLHMAIAGIPWWNSDIGGFHGARNDDEAYHELFVRWFQYGTFCPVMRLHSFHDPYIPSDDPDLYGTGAPNEIWCYGDKVFEICKKFINLREQMKPYIEKIMREAHEIGTPIMRPMFYSYPNQDLMWDLGDQYMFGPDILVAPITEQGSIYRSVALPTGQRWINPWTNEVFDGGLIIQTEATIDIIPLYVKEGASCLEYLKIET